MRDHQESDFAFAHPEDHVLFGLLVAHGLVPADSMSVLVAFQREENGAPLVEILARSSELEEKTRRDVEELLRILRTPELARLLPATLPPVETIVDMARTERAEVPETQVDDNQSSTVTLPHVDEDDERTVLDPGLADRRLQAKRSTVASVSSSLTAEELERLENSMHKAELIGEEISGHVVLDRIGAGGQGDVFLAKQISLNRYVALKKLVVPIPSQAHRFLEAFRAEAQMLGRVNHGRIVKVYDIFEADGEAYFTMEHIQGKTLFGLVQESKVGVPLDVVANLACQACSALEVTAEKGLVHRDIKPANMMVDENGDLKIVDFGLAAAADELGGGSKLGFAGTPQFAAPEQFKGDSLSPMADMYSLGATLYFALTGRVPHEAKLIGDLRNAHIEIDPEPPSHVNSQLPSAVDRVVLKMMAKDPAQRFSSFDACFAAWEELLRRFARSGAEATSTRQLLGAGLSRFGRTEKDRIQKVSIILGGSWVLLTLGAILGEGYLRRWRVEWVLDAMGTWGSLLLLFSLSCIAYVALARRGILPIFGSLRGWLYTHIATAIPSVVMLLIHSGNFLTHRAPGPQMGPPYLSILMGVVLIVTAISGTVGLLIFRALRRRLILARLELRGAKLSEREEMLTTLGARALSGWRLVHYPLAVFFVALAIVHILQALRFGVS